MNTAYTEEALSKLSLNELSELMDLTRRAYSTLYFNTYKEVEIFSYSSNISHKLEEEICKKLEAIGFGK